MNLTINTARGLYFIVIVTVIPPTGVLKECTYSFVALTVFLPQRNVDAISDM